jgi:hypothetical protein
MLEFLTRIPGGIVIVHVLVQCGYDGSGFGHRMDFGVFRIDNPRARSPELRCSRFERFKRFER